MKKIEKVLLEKLGDKNIELERYIVDNEKDLDKVGKEYNQILAKIQTAKNERYKVRADIRLVCSGKKPKNSSEFKEKKKAKK